MATEMMEVAVERTVEIATLGPNVRLVVIQFMVRTNKVPDLIPLKRGSSQVSAPRASGVKVLESTPDLDLFPLISRLDISQDYELVDVWRKTHDTDWKKSIIRFVYCHKDYVRHDELFPGFVADREKLKMILVDLVSKNLWTAQTHLNPYFEDDGSESGQSVLMFGCVARKPNIEVFRDGRDEYNRGLGPKVLLSTLASKLRLIEDEWVQLERR